MREVIFVCKKLPRIRSGHGVLVYNSVMQKSEREVVLDSSECVLIVATTDTKANEAMYLETCLEGAGVPVPIMDAGIKIDSPVQVGIGLT